MSRRASRAWAFDALGLLPAARFLASPNCDERPAGERVTLLVIHSISLPPGRLQRRCGRRSLHEPPRLVRPSVLRGLAELRVSAHFFVRRRGELLQFVPASKRAWHAGVSAWKDRERCNDFSVGIELEGTDATPFTAAQYRTPRPAHARAAGTLPDRRHRRPCRHRARAQDRSRTLFRLGALSEAVGECAVMRQAIRNVEDLLHRSLRPAPSRRAPLSHGKVRAAAAAGSRIADRRGRSSILVPQRRPRFCAPTMAIMLPGLRVAPLRRSRCGASDFPGRRRWWSAPGGPAERPWRPAGRRSRTASRVNLAGGTHHAFRDRGEGYCVFNDSAIAALAMQAEGRARRVVVVDCDVHQGNGTAAILAGDPSVFTFSIHGANNFPFTKESERPRHRARRRHGRRGLSRRPAAGSRAARSAAPAPISPSISPAPTPTRMTASVASRSPRRACGSVTAWCSKPSRTGASPPR